MVARFRADTLCDKGRTAFQRPSLQSQSWFVFHLASGFCLGVIATFVFGFCGTLKLNILVRDFTARLASFQPGDLVIFLQLLSTVLYFITSVNGFSRITVG